MTAVFMLPLLFVSPLHAEETDEIRILQKEAEKGLAESQNKLAGLYYEGKGITQNYETAAYWYRKAAKQGHILAQNNLADMFAEGKGVEQSYKQAVYWYKKSAEQGHAWAQNNLGFMYKEGLGVEQNYKQAVYWYSKAAEQGLYTRHRIILALCIKQDGA